MLQRTKIFIPVICYNNTCNTYFMFSLIKLIMALKEAGIDTTLYPIGFESLICRARNASIAQFMSNNCTHILFLDTDIEFEVEGIFKLINAKEKVIGAAYALKTLWPDKIKDVYTREVIPTNPLNQCTKHGVHVLQSGKHSNEKIEVEYLTTGCMLIEKSVIDIMIRVYPERKYTNDIDGYFPDTDVNLFYNLFAVEINKETNKYESEDYCFCRLWRQQGGKIYVIPDITLIHHGSFGYGMNMKDYMDNMKITLRDDDK